MSRFEDTETSAKSTGTSYAGGGKLDPMQHLSHPIQPEYFNITINRKLNIL